MQQLPVRGGELREPPHGDFQRTSGASREARVPDAQDNPTPPHTWSRRHVLIEDCQITGRAGEGLKNMLRALHSYAGHEWDVDDRDIAKQLNVTVRTVEARWKTLETRGLIDTRRLKREFVDVQTGRRSEREYRWFKINFEALGCRQAQPDDTARSLAQSAQQSFEFLRIADPGTAEIPAPESRFGDGSLGGGAPPGGPKPRQERGLLDLKESSDAAPLRREFSRSAGNEFEARQPGPGPGRRLSIPDGCGRLARDDVPRRAAPHDAAERRDTGLLESRNPKPITAPSHSEDSGFQSDQSAKRDAAGLLARHCKISFAAAELIVAAIDDEGITSTEVLKLCGVPAAERSRFAAHLKREFIIKQVVGIIGKIRRGLVKPSERIQSFASLFWKHPNAWLRVPFDDPESYAEVFTPSGATACGVQFVPWEES